MKNKDYFKYILSLLKPYRKEILLISILMLISGVGNMIIPLLQKGIVDEGILKKDEGTLIILVIIAIIINLGINILTYLQNKIQISINSDFSKSMQVKVMNHLLRIEKEHIDSEGVLKIYKNADYCVESLSVITGTSVLLLFLEIFKFFGIITAILIINWKLALFTFTFIPIKLITTIVISKFISKYSDLNIKEHQKLHKWEEDVFSTIPELKLWNLFDFKSQEHKKILDNIFNIFKKNSLLGVKDTQIGEALAHTIFYLLYLLSGFMIWKDSLTVGGLIVIVSYFTYMLQPVGLFSSLGIIFSNIKPVIDKYQEFLRIPTEIDFESYDKNLFHKNLSPNISIEELKFSFKEKIILNNINLEIMSGEKIALVGENGAGKTTLIDILLRFKKPQEGSINLNGKSIENISLTNYRNLFGVVAQNPNLFNDTIQNNLTAFNRYELDYKILEMPLFKSINNLPNGIKSLVGSKSTMLSGGEKQKIALMRALMKKPSILILDEPTSNYDSESKNEFIELLTDIECTTVIVTHDNQVLKEIDKIILIQDGQAYIYNGYNDYLNSEYYLSKGEIL